MSDTDWLLLGAIFVLLITSAVFAMAETAFVRMNRIRAMTLEEEGRRLLIKQASGPDVRLRIASDTDIDGAATDRSQLKVGMKLTATYQVPQGFNAALGYDVIEMIVE